MENLGINPVQIIAQIVNFFILFFVLNKFLYKPVLTALKNRKKTIEESLQASEEIDQRKAHFESEIEKKHQESIVEAHKQKQKSIKDAEIEANQILQTAHKDAEKIRAAAVKEAESYLAHAHKKHDEEISAQVVALSKKALSKLVSEKSQREISKSKVKEFLRQ